MALRTREFALDAAGIDAASEAAYDFLNDETKLDRRSVLSARLTFENALIRMQEHFGDGTPAQLMVGSRLGKPLLAVKVRGERFDPREGARQAEWERSLMEAAGLRPSFAYRGGANTIAITCPRPPMGSTLRAAVAIVIGLLISQVGLRFPEQVRTTLLDGLVMPLFEAYTGMLAGIAGPMVFFSVAWGICGIGDMAALGRSGKVLIRRFLEADALGAIIALLVGVPVFRLEAAAVAGGEGSLASVTELLLGMLPTNMVQPFVEGNTLQIIVLSVAVGVAALAMGELTEGVRQALRQLNELIQFLMEQLCRLLPGFIVVMMVSQSWSGTTSILLSSWMPILVFAVGLLLLLALLYLGAAVRCRVPLKTLLVSCIPAQVLAFTTALPSAAFGIMVATCKDDFGVNEDQVSFGIPLGMVLCKPSAPVLITVLMLYCAQSFGVGADALWYVKLGILSLLFAIAVPPVPGGMLACYSMILANLGIPLDALVVVTALDLLVDNPCALTNVTGLMLSVLSAADSLGAVDHTKLERRKS